MLSNFLGLVSLGVFKGGGQSWQALGEFWDGGWKSKHFAARRERGLQRSLVSFSTLDDFIPLGDGASLDLRIWVPG